MEKVNLVDTLFNHATSTSLLDSKFIEWDRTLSNKNNPVIFTETSFNKIYDTDNIGWIIESPYFTEHIYSFVLENLNKFRHILTCDKTLLDLNEKFKFAPFGGCWIQEKNWGLHEKTKKFSIIASYKRETIGHKLRHDIIYSARNNIDVYGNGYNKIENKIEGLKDYMYNFVVENVKKDYYFTEKLIDCLLTGTVPIYWGCPSIGNFFDINGFVTFNSMEDLKEKLKYCNENDFKSKRKSIENNFEEAKKYVLAEDYLYKKDKSLLGL